MVNPVWESPIVFPISKVDDLVAITKMLVRQPIELIRRARNMIESHRHVGRNTRLRKDGY